MSQRDWEGKEQGLAQGRGDTQRGLGSWDRAQGGERSQNRARDPSVEAQEGMPSHQVAQNAKPSCSFLGPFLGCLLSRDEVMLV